MLHACTTNNYPSQLQVWCYVQWCLTISHVSMCCFKDWTRVRIRVRVHKLSALIKLFLVINFTFEIAKVRFIFMFLIKLVASNQCGFSPWMCVATTHSHYNNHLENHPSGLRRWNEQFSTMFESIFGQPKLKNKNKNGATVVNHYKISIMSM